VYPVFLRAVLVLATVVVLIGETAQVFGLHDEIGLTRYDTDFG